MHRFSCRSLLIAVPAAALLLPSGASAHRRLYLSMASARRAITTYERSYWEGESVSMRIVRCNRHDAVRVTCNAKAESAEGATRISTTDSATLLPEDIIRVHPGRVEEVLVLQG
jgi:hypothetical protein